jgi:hypothetical protein
MKLRINRLISVDVKQVEEYNVSNGTMFIKNVKKTIAESEGDTSHLQGSNVTQLPKCNIMNKLKL